MKQLISRIALFSILVAVAFFVGSRVAPHPSDREMEQRLIAHEAEFNRLIDMLFEDKEIAIIDYDYVFPEQGSSITISNERLREYRSLFRKIGLDVGAARDNPNTIRLVASRKGLFLPRSEKSYVYSKIEPTPLVDSLDEIAKENSGKHSPVYRRLKGNWYLYYEIW
jgi:hypothetical protein